MAKKCSEALRCARSVSDEKMHLLSSNSNDCKCLSDEEVILLIKEFCDAKDLIGVKPVDAWKIFCEFTNERGVGVVYRERFATLARKVFPGLKRKRVRLGKNNLIWVYAIDENAGR